MERMRGAAVFQAQTLSEWEWGGGCGGKRWGKGELPAASRGVIWRQLCAT